MNVRQMILAMLQRAAFLFVALPVFLTVSGPLQAADPPLSQWVHEQWRTDRGLPQNSVYSLAQDANGFLWIGTENGLVRYDGFDFKVFAQRQPVRLRHNLVSSLLVDRDGSLWIGTRTGGLVRYKDDIFSPPPPELMRERVQALAQTPDGALWVGTTNGLLRLLGNSLSSFTTKDSLPGNSITSLLVSTNGSLWAGFGNGHLAQYQNGSFRVFTNHLARRQSAVLALAEDFRSGDILAALDGDGLVRLHLDELTRVLLLGHEVENLQALLVARDGAIWVGTQYDGLVRWKEGEVSRLSLQNGLDADNVISLTQDREGFIWVGTLFRGLHRLHLGPITTFRKNQGLSAEAINCVVESSPGKLVIGTRNDGALTYEHGEFRAIERDGIPKDVRALLRTADGAVWMGGKEGGLFHTSSGQWLALTTADGLLANDVSALFQSRSGEVWIGSQRSGITVIDPQTLAVTRHLTNEFLRTHIRCFAESANVNTVWIGTQHGLVRLKDGILTPKFIDGYEDATIRSIIPDSQDVLWIGTRDDGLIRLSSTEPKRLSCFDPDRGLMHSRIYQLVPRGEVLWIAGNRGIERVAFSELNALAAGKETELFPQILTERDGLAIVECGSDASPSAILGSDGRIWIATRLGLSVLQPEHVPIVSAAPQAFITKVRLDQAALPPTGFKTVPAGTSRVQFSYTAVEMRDGINLTYKHKLDGVDHDWVDTGREREAAYNNLKPGRYIFRVLASRDQRFDTAPETTLAFAVAPQVYQTGWFLSGTALLCAGLVRGVYAWRVAGIKKRNEMLQQLVRVRTSELEDEIVHRKHAEEQQIALNADLENRVQQRTYELTTAYEDLRGELQERQRIESELASSEARLRRVVDSGMVGILFWNHQGRIFDANETFLKMVGYSQEDLRAGVISWQELTPPEFTFLDDAALEEIRQTGVCTPFEKEYYRKDGSRFPVLIGGALLGRDKEDGVCFVLDISERKAAEENIRLLALSLEERVQERTLELARINQQLAGEVQERKRVAVALSAFSQLGQKLHGARTENEAANIIALTAKSLIPHDICTIELYDQANQLYPVICSQTSADYPATEPMRSSISVPIRNGSRVIGVIGLRSTLPGMFEIADANTLQALGDYCGGALDRIHAEEARRETERRFAAFMANAPALAWMKDHQLRYVFTNPVFQKFLGQTAEEIEDKDDTRLWPDSSAADRIRANDLKVFESKQPLESQETLRRADGEDRILLTLRFPFTTGTGERFVAGMAVDVTEQKRAEEALHRLPQSILEAQEQERRRLARELHDSVNQAIASAKFRIQTAENQILRGDAKWQESCSKSKEMLDLVLKQVRRLSHNLRPGELDDLGLLAAARTAFHEFEARTGIDVHFQADGFEERLVPPLESTLYRVIQEALTNIEKHAGASAVDVQLTRDPSGVTLDIHDNGVGFDPASKSGYRGLGLLHMRERAGLVGGSFSIEATPGNGVHIRLTIPNHPRPSHV